MKYAIDPKSALTCLGFIIPTFYKLSTLFDDITNTTDYVNGVDISLKVLRSKKEINTEAGLRLRGPHMCSKLKSTLEGMNMPIRQVTYSYVDELPEPLMYFNQLGLPPELIQTCMSVLGSLPDE